VLASMAISSKEYMFGEGWVMADSYTLWGTILVLRSRLPTGQTLPPTCCALRRNHKLMIVSRTPDHLARANWKEYGVWNAEAAQLKQAAQVREQ